MGTIFAISFLVSIVSFGIWFYQKKKKDDNNPFLKKLAIISGVVFLVSGAFANPSQIEDVTTKVTESKPEVTQPKEEAKEETKEETTIEDIDFETEIQDDSSLPKGTTKVQQEGQKGTREKTWKITYKDGEVISRQFISEKITKEPVEKIVLNGTYVTPVSSSSCDPNYSGACVPIASDVDCGGGNGNGPEYVWGPVYVIGRDIYDLDRDNDGVGCEN